MSVALKIVRRDMRLAWAQGGGAYLALAFFVITVTLFPFGVGPEPGMLARIAPGVLWVAALLACLLSLDRLFAADYEDGSLEGLVLLPEPLSLVVGAKCLAHWLSTALPLILIAPFLAMMLNLEPAAYPVLMLSMLIGTPGLSAIGAVGAALTVGLRRAGVLIALIVLPLNIPILIFAVAATEAARNGFDPQPHLMLLAACSIFSLVFGLWAAAAALKVNLE
ncbi:heme exporter protein CcmB [Govanella unica]|uniref:Heme exporter protein B n=1 Tax=Govanella unica TaxID=2975056 RepID=A0A9X3Z697_9PROT|nr:heme exporter protein CcmB [Govania unica]MDA5192709.1 heme exporter protein CcmB [Govania unica]